MKYSAQSNGLRENKILSERLRVYFRKQNIGKSMAFGHQTGWTETNRHSQISRRILERQCATDNVPALAAPINRKIIHFNMGTMAGLGVKGFSGKLVVIIDESANQRKCNWKGQGI